MGKHVRWTMWNLLVAAKFSQPKVPKMEHLDTFGYISFLGRDGFC